MSCLIDADRLSMQNMEIDKSTMYSAIAAEDLPLHVITSVQQVIENCQEVVFEEIEITEEEI